jgi:hypothetical protein
MQLTYKLALILLCLITTSCSLTQQYRRIAKQYDLDSQIITINGFRLQVYANQPYIQNLKQLKIPIDDLHVYIEGDGRAWKSLHTPSKNPTPKSPIMLKLMTLDPMPSIYVGRPCYYLQNNKCDVLLWTFARYGDDVVVALTQAYEQLSSHYSSLTLIGHSGGGALAMLIASRLYKTKTVVTLAGNIDSDAWTTHHHYSPLYLSHNPAKQPLLPKHIRQFHYAGSNDTNVLPRFIKETAERENAHYDVLDGFDHTCCWEHRWPLILKSLALESKKKTSDHKQ